jgi:hypothetical protein
MINTEYKLRIIIVFRYEYLDAAKSFDHHSLL